MQALFPVAAKGRNSMLTDI